MITYFILSIYSIQRSSLQIKPQCFAAGGIHEIPELQKDKRHSSHKSSPETFRHKNVPFVFHITCSCL